jgi:CBS domain-containing protein
VSSFFNPFLMFVALFVWIGTAAEAATVVTRSTLRGLPVRAAMLTRFATLGPFHTLGAAADLRLAGSDTDFPVLQAGQLVGIVTRSDLVRGLAERGPDVVISGSAAVAQWCSRCAPGEAVARSRSARDGA